MRATALQPPPPTPITLIRVPRRASSSISYFRLLMSLSMNPMLVLLTNLPTYKSFSNLQNLSQNPAGSPLFLCLQFGGIHRQAGDHTPLRTVHRLRPVA